MKKYLKLKTKTYRSKEYNDYLNSINDSDIQDEADAWKVHIKKEMNVPASLNAEVRLDPDTIVCMIETPSLEAWAANPANPKHDCLDLYLKDGLVITVISTLKEMEKQIDKLYNEG